MTRNILVYKKHSLIVQTLNTDILDVGDPWHHVINTHPINKMKHNYDMIG